MNRSVIIASGLMFGAPFVLLALCYGALPPELPVLRILLGHAAAFAAKSIFIVFRVPLMNLIHGVMAAVMITRNEDFESAHRRASYASIFTTLLFTVAIKSDFEALELSSAAAPAVLRMHAGWLTAGTVLSVLTGLGLAVVRSQGAPLPWPELRLRIRDKIALIGLFAFYIGLVIAALSVAHRAEIPWN